MNNSKNHCYCGNKLSYTECCKIAHLNIKKVQTAEQLMRSRYSAFVLADGDYLMKSHHATTRPIKEKRSIVKWAKSVQWIRLEVLDATDGLLDNEKGTVNFKAFFFENGSVQVIQENSLFKKENGVWFYIGKA